MRSTYTILCCFISLCFYTSCECAGQHNAYVLDAVSKKPVVDAKVSGYKVRDGDEMFERDEYTDSNGHYDIGFFSGSGLRKCPGFKVYIYKEGYQVYTIEHARFGEEDTVYLQKEL